MAKKKGKPRWVPVQETHRYTIKEAALSFGTGWRRKCEYSFTNRGCYFRLTLYNPEAKAFRYRWARASGMTDEKLEAKGYKLTKRRKPKEMKL